VASVGDQRVSPVDATVADTLGRIDFFVYSRAARTAADGDHPAALDEAHWSYMDEYADTMVARGPTLAADRATWTGSLHILDLPSAEAARAFAEHEPYNRAGLFGEHVIRRFENRLGRTMWEVAGQPSDDPRFLVLAHGGEWGPPAREGLIVGGTLLAPDGTQPAGIAVVVQAPDRETAAAVLGEQGAGPHLDVEIHDWEPGGRR
jgi:uncharacterized protein YciI